MEGREYQVRVSLRSVKRCGTVDVTVKKLRKPAIVYKIAPLGISEPAGHKIVRVASVVKCW